MSGKNSDYNQINKNLNDFEFNNENENDLEEFDAFNEETFASNLNEDEIGDWEAEHDQLIQIENLSFSNEPESKLQISQTKDNSLNKTPEPEVPKLAKILPNVKTLEEIEAELLNNSANKSISYKNSEPSKYKNCQDSDLLRLFPKLANQPSTKENSPLAKINGNGEIPFSNKSQLFTANFELQELTNKQQQPLLQQLRQNSVYPNLLNPGIVINNQLNQPKPDLFQYERTLPIVPSQDKMIELMRYQQNQVQMNALLKNMIGLNNFPRSDLNIDFLKLAKTQDELIAKVKPQLNSQQKPLMKDKLSGMMTDKEKNWVVSVQMLQLQNDDPYSYDFYYTAWMLKKKNMNSQNSHLSGLKTLLNQTANKNDPKNYRPLTFENSLGKVTMSNFHHPRALIDVNSKSPDHINLSNQSLISQIESIEEDGDKPKEKKNLSTILLEIEQMYLVYLNVDEIEHRILKEPGEMRANLFQERRLKVDKLASMMCSENFAHYLFVTKGRRLLGKCIPTFNSIHTKQILAYFMQYIYVISKNNICLDEIYAQISYAVDTQKFNDITEILTQFNQIYTKQSNQVYKTIFSNKFALTFLLKFFSKSEMIVQDDYDMHIKSIWSLYLNNVLNGFNTLPDDGINLRTVVYEAYVLNINAIFDNISINIDLWNKHEKKLGELFIFSD